MDPVSHLIHSFYVAVRLPPTLAQCSRNSDILTSAGKPGDRWALLRKKLGREESPDTVVFAFYAWDESLCG